MENRGPWQVVGGPCGTTGERFRPQVPAVLALAQIRDFRTARPAQEERAMTAVNPTMVGVHLGTAGPTPFPSSHPSFLSMPPTYPHPHQLSPFNHQQHHHSSAIHHRAHRRDASPPSSLFFPCRPLLNKPSRLRRPLLISPPTDCQKSPGPS